MGGSVSIPTTSQSTKSILEFILRELFRRADLVDMYSLADPTRCSAYIVATGDALNKVFATQMIQPKKGKGGIVYFQRIKAFQTDQAIKTEQATLCKELSFYFIRIFQIYGALALSVLDTEIPQTNIEEPMKTRRVGRERYEGLAPGPVRGFEQQQSSGWWGGALSNRVLRDGRTDPRASFYITGGRFAMLNKYLDAPSDGGDTQSFMYFTDNKSMYIKQDQLYDFTPQRVYKNPETVTIYYSSYDNTSTRIFYSAKMALEPDGDDIKLRLTDLKKGTDSQSPNEIVKTLIKNPADDKYYDPVTKYDFTKVLTTSLVPQSPLTIVRFLKKFRYLSEITSRDQKIEGTNLSVVNPLANINQDTIQVFYKKPIKIEKSVKDAYIYFNLSMAYSKTADYTYIITIDLSPEAIKDSRPKPFMASLINEDEKIRGKKIMTFTASRENEEPISARPKQQTFPAYIERIFGEMYTRFEKVGSQYISRGIQYTREGVPRPYESSTMEDPYRVKSLWDALARRPPIKAHCVARALQLLSVAGIRGDKDQTKIYSDACSSKFLLERDHSLPTTGSEITTSHGIDAFVNLFRTGTPTIAEKYQVQLRRLSAAFDSAPGAPVPGASASVPNVIRPSAIKTAKCERQGRVPIPANDLYKVRGIVQKLLARQKLHVNAVVYLLGKLFDMNQIKKGVFMINSRIVAGGLDEVNRVGEEALTLLLGYYEGCETDYKAGRTIVSGIADKASGSVIANVDAADAPDAADAAADAANARAANEDDEDNNN